MAELRFFRVLSAADRFLRDHPELARLSSRKWSFADGGDWMTAVLGRMRGRRLTARSLDFTAIGRRKYGASIAYALTLGLIIQYWSLPLAGGGAILAFYCREVRDVFAFPAAIDHGHHSRRATRALFARAGGTLNALGMVLPMAAVMLLGGLGGRGFVRSWLLGCAAVLFWYEEVRTERSPASSALDLLARGPVILRRIGESPSGAYGSSILYASDLHLGAPGADRAMRALRRFARRERPALILLGGDLADRDSALPRLDAWLRALTAICPVAAIPGNHDGGSRCERSRATVERAGAHWLPDHSLRVAGLRVDGVPQASELGATTERRLLCAHDPAVFEHAADLGYDLVLAGHLHGGQAVLWQWRGRLYPGALVYRWNGLEFRRGRTTMWVSRGLADTLPIRLFCPREVLHLQLPLATRKRPGAGLLAVLLHAR